MGITPYSPTQKKKLRDTMPLYCAYACAHEWKIGYDQGRRFYYYSTLGSSYATLDCSGFVGNVFWNAMHDTAIYIHDPLDGRYQGVGNTWSMERWLRGNGKLITTQGYLVGDITRYGEGLHAHTTICTKRGTALTADWTSHGREAGPLVVKLGYRDDLIGVWRHPALA
jgi:hypothetical protein